MSKRRSLLAAVLLGLAVAGTARAGEGKPVEPGTSVEMPILVAPMVVDERLQAYAYISCTIVATSSAAAIAIRLKTPFIRDAFVRDVNGKPVVKADAPDKFDTDAVRARLLADARRVTGADNVAALIFTQVQISPMRTGGP